MFNESIMEDEMDPMMGMEMPPPAPQMTRNGGIQPKQEFVSPGDMPEMGMGGGMGDPLFDTLMSNQIQSPMPQDPSMGGMEGMMDPMMGMDPSMGMDPGMQGPPPPAMPPPQPPGAMNPPVSDMMQDPNLFNEMMMRKAPPNPNDPMAQMGPQPPQF